MMDRELASDVTEELFWDPKVDNASIAVDADDGAVTLRGTVGSFREKREAKTAAERVYGVTSVTNDLEVRLLDDERRNDADLRAAVLQALMLDSVVPSTVDASVEDGYVTLTGKANWQFERDEAEFVAANVAGVISVYDLIELESPTPAPSDVKHSIKKALERNAKLDANGVDVESSDGTVKLSGFVRSWAEHDEAIDAAWAAPGVKRVTDDLVVSY